MSSISAVVTSVLGIKSARDESVRPDVRRAPMCEALEGRQLLNGNLGFARAPLMWDGAAGGAGSTEPAHVHHWNGVKDLRTHQFPGSGSSAQGNSGQDMFMSNPQAKTDFQNLQTDIKTLQSEVPATLQTQLRADKATIDQAIASLTPAQRRAEHKALPSGTTTPPSDPTAFLTAQLKAANVPDAQINQIVTDFQTYQTTLHDLPLYAKVTADQAALAKDLPAGHNALPQGNPGFLMGRSL